MHRKKTCRRQQRRTRRSWTCRRDRDGGRGLEDAVPPDPRNLAGDLGVDEGDEVGGVRGRRGRREDGVGRPPLPPLLAEAADAKGREGGVAVRHLEGLEREVDGLALARRGVRGEGQEARRAALPRERGVDGGAEGALGADGRRARVPRELVDEDREREGRRRPRRAVDGRAARKGRVVPRPGRDGRRVAGFAERREGLREGAPRRGAREAW